MIKSKHIMITSGEDKDARIFKIIRNDQGINNNSYTLVRSSLDQNWTDPNQVIGGLMDGGNDLSVLIGEQHIVIDYSQAEGLYLLLREHLKDGTYPVEIRAISKKERV